MNNNNNNINLTFEKALDLNFKYRYKHLDAQSFELGITLKNKDQYLRKYKDEYKLKKTGNGYYLSEPYNRLIYNLKMYFGDSIRCISDHYGKTKFWVAYEYEKPKLWSLIEKDTIKAIIRNKLIIQYLWEPSIVEDVVDLLYKSLCARLLSAPIFEEINFDIFLDNNTYKLMDYSKEFNSLYEHKYIFVYPKVALPNHKHFFVVLDKNNKLLTLEEQIQMYKNLLSKKGR